MRIPTITALLLFTAAALAQENGDPVRHALEQAQARRVPVLVDFHAPWCYSCYYMSRHVLTGPEWERTQREAVIVELDADAPEGARWMQAWNVKVLPSYLVLDSNGNELGRLLGEQTRADFYVWLFDVIARGDTLEALKARVHDASAESVTAAREVLAAHHARYDADGGLAWFLGLPPAVRVALARDAEAALWVGRLELLRAHAARDLPACRQAGEAVLAGNLACARPYELDKLMACTAEEPALTRRMLLRPHAEQMQLLFEKRVLAEGYRCADERSIVLTAADALKAIESTSAEMLVLDRAIGDLRARLGDDLKSDRSLADNLRVYLDRAGRTDELEQLLVQLIDAWPDDYVYAFRLGRNLAGRGEHARAVPYFERAAAHAYGINRLRNADVHARSLQALGRVDDARNVLGEALQANGPWFPEEAARLRALRDELAPASL
jgi:hypothetical protein